MGFINSVKELYDFIVKIQNNNKIKKQDEFTKNIYNIYNTTKTIVNELITFFQCELEKIESNQYTYLDIVHDFNKFRNQSRFIRIEIRNTIKYTDVFLDNKDLKIFAIGIMAILNGGIAIRINGHRLDKIVCMDLYDILLELVDDDTKLEDFYFVEGHVIMDTINKKECEEYILQTERLKQLLYDEKDIYKQREIKKMLDKRNVNRMLYWEIKHQINDIYKAWDVVATSYVILKNKYST